MLSKMKKNDSYRSSQNSSSNISNKNLSSAASSTSFLSNYQRQLKGGGGKSTVMQYGQVEKRARGTRERVDKTRERLEGDRIDEIFGFQRMKEVCYVLLSLVIIMMWFIRV